MTLATRRARLVPLLLAVAAAATGLPSPAVAREISHSQELKARTFSLMSDGINAYKRGEAKKAIELLSHVADVAMNSFRAHYFLGLAFKLDRQYSKAIDPITFALELDPTNMQAHVDLGDCYLRRGDSDEALAEYQRALAIQANFAPAWDGLARAAQDTGDDEKAEENFKKAIAMNPGFPDASLNLGDLYLRKNRLDEATTLFLKAIGVRPDFAAAYNRLGVAYARQRLVNEAIAALRKAAQLEQGSPWHPYTIGVIEMEFDSLSEAGRDFDAAISLDRNYLEAYAAKARLFRRLGDFDAATRLLDEALTRPSEDEKLKRDIADLRASMAAEGQALRSLTRKADDGTAVPDDLRSLARLRAEMGDYAGAAAALKAARAASGSADGAADSPADAFALGYDLLRASLYEEAEGAFRTLRERKPASVAVTIDLALALQGQGKNAAAEGVLEDAVRLAPNDTTALLALGNAYIINGRYDAAAGVLEKAIGLSTTFEGRPRAETILKMLRAHGAPASGTR
ncbi:MAG: tetratricopeptide repeat protein [Acidobacteria bacterium]|nr:tetratricopeptide repeat protein [Acidobacteriota bacterium]